MITIYITGLFIIALVSVYSLIQSKANRWLVFFMIPLILVMSLYTWRAITILQGTPLDGLPYKETISIVHIDKRKPTITLLLKHKGDALPKYYAIPWTRENNDAVSKLQSRAKKGLDVEGKFSKPEKNSVSESLSFFFEATPDFSNTNPKNN